MSLSARVAAAESRITHAEERAAAAGARLVSTQVALREATGELAGVEARLHTIEELEASLEGHVPGTRAVLEAVSRRELDGIVGVVSQLIRVDEAYARALDVAFGAGLSNIVSLSAEEAERAIAYLRQRERGRATFLPLDVLGNRTARDLNGAPRRPGVVGWAHALVETEPAYRGIVAFLVGRTLVVESLDVGVDLVRDRSGEPFRDAIVTLDGDEIRGGGAMTGGRYARERSLLSRRAQAHTLRERLPILREAHAFAEAAATAASEEGVAAAKARDEARGLVAHTMLAMRDARGAFDALRSEQTRVDDEAKALRSRIGERERQLLSVRERGAALDRPVVDQAVTQARRAELEERLTRKAKRIAQTQEAGEREVSGRDRRRTRRRVATLSAQRDGATTRLALLDTDRDRVARARAEIVAELADLTRTLEAGGAQINHARRDVAGRDAEAEAARVEREAMAGRQNAYESSLRLAQREERESHDSAEATRRRLAEIDAELGMLTATFAQNPATADECADVAARHANERDDPIARAAAVWRGSCATSRTVNPWHPRVAASVSSSPSAKPIFRRSSPTSRRRVRRCSTASMRSRPRRKRGSTRPSTPSRKRSRSSSRVFSRGGRRASGRPIPTRSPRRGSSWRCSRRGRR